MSQYYNYDFVSPEPLIAEVKEELKSYFDTGVIDDLLFPRYIENCLQRLGKSSNHIKENVFKITQNMVNLPEDFYAVRELWICNSVDTNYQLPTACYEQKTFRITPMKDRCDPLEYCPPNQINVTYKTTNTIHQSFNVYYPLKPGNISVGKYLGENCINVHSDAPDTFDIRDGKLITNFTSGYVYMIYYALEYDSENYQLIPDNIRIKDYIKAYLKYKSFETIFNQITDESYKQVESKFAYYKREADEAKQIAEIEIKKKTIHQLFKSIKDQRNRFRYYQIT